MPGTLYIRAYEASEPFSLGLRAYKRLSKLEKVPMTIDPSSVLTHFDDYAVEGEEPADLLLSDLVPPQLSELNLPHAPKQAIRAAKSPSPSTIRVPSKLYRPLSA